MKRACFAVILLLVASLLQACAESRNQSISHPETEQFLEKSKESTYLSLTVTNKKSENHYFTYDLETKVLEEAAITPDTAQYPLGAVDRTQQLLYYAERDSTGSDQLFKLDLKTKQKEQLTKNLFAINYMIPAGNLVILAAASKEKNSVQPVTFNTETKQLNFWFGAEDDDTSVEDLTFNPYTSRLYATLFSAQEGRRNSKKTAETQADDTVPAVHRVVEYDLNGKSLRELYSAQEKIVRFHVSKDAKQAIMRSAPMVFERRELYLYDLETKRREKLDIPGISTVSHAVIAPDEKGLFILGVPNSMGEASSSIEKSGPPNGLYYFNLDTRQVTPIFIKDEHYINNFVLLKQ
ncbi:hypothetical protein [Paenibacillus ehimensis]|uniref:hypothetical protein n=1 Tax=Paenibacillus ehimensis TaxID=79264 RepID=UPI0004711C9D|nr:hypothetical protein [Paenibacillus ehimensis]